MLYIWAEQNYLYRGYTEFYTRRKIINRRTLSSLNHLSSDTIKVYVLVLYSPSRSVIFQRAGDYRVGFTSRRHRTLLTAISVPISALILLRWNYTATSLCWWNATTLFYLQSGVVFSNGRSTTLFNVRMLYWHNVISRLFLPKKLKWVGKAHHFQLRNYIQIVTKKPTV